VLPGLSGRFTPQAMEHTLATLFFGLANEVDRIADALQPGRSRIQQNLQGLRGSRSSSPRGDVYDIELAYSPSFFLEEGLIAIARAEIGRDPGLVVLLHDESWLRLISTGVVAVNSFEFAVIRHWLDALDQQAERAAARGAETHRILSLISASLSLIALVVPPLAPLAFASDLLMLSFMIYGAVAKLTTLETGIQQQLPALASGAYEAIVAVGQTVTALAAYRRELAFEVVTQLAMLPVARIRAVGRILQSWAYVSDVYTLYQVTRRE
jgi:hypothetical protein